MSDHDLRTAVLRANAAPYAETAIACIDREYPNYAGLGVDGPEQYREPWERHPAFYGSYDWHSAVEMHWVLIRLLRLVPDAVDERVVRAALDRHLTPETLAGEVAYCRAHPGFERPYGWAWCLMLADAVDDLAQQGDADAQRWGAALEELAVLFAGGFVQWLPKQRYPVRSGLHPNTAFALGRSLPWARRRAERGLPGADLHETLVATAERLFVGDTGYDARFEPSGSDFLSPALIEAELIGAIFPDDRFAAWLTAFLPALGDALPPALAHPVTVDDPTDGQGGHLHGLNLSRAWTMRRIAAALPPGDHRRSPLERAAGDHAVTALPHVVGSSYMVEHWLAVYALLWLADE
ncbi:MAG TPA: DUF2891 domain-containing protein [Thermomicrobiales bacterium]|jgi:hypothetical protein|nr:DUF2891 domain-containing protein [Thermomicrobiales bacterium]